jgi:glycosyltransferase involved in cell wall biosynthesis
MNQIILRNSSSQCSGRLPADEIVVNDCNSTDEIPHIVQSYIDVGYPIRLVKGGYNIPSGRNNAIFHATGDIVAVLMPG